jgi:hypothetical protein
MFRHDARKAQAAREMKRRRAPWKRRGVGHRERRFIKVLGLDTEMRERPADDTTKEPEGARRKGEPESEPGGYYYDDGTGYEVYAPSEEDEAEGPNEACGAEKD